MTRCVSTAIIVLGLGIGQSTAQSPIYINTGLNDNYVQIDAFAFHNLGQFVVSGGGLPYSMQSVRSYTNDFGAIMSGDFRLDTVTPTDRSPAENIVNRGTITTSSWNLLSAQKIVNPGVLDTTGFGLLEIKGGEVNLTRGGHRALSLTFPSTDNGLDDGTNYVAPNGVFDVYWGSGTNGVLENPEQDGFNMNAENLVTPNPVSPGHEVLPLAGNNPQTTSMPNIFGGEYQAFANMTVADDGTNEFRQVIFVNTTPENPDLTVNVGLANFNQQSGLGNAMVEFGMTDIDVTTGNPFTRNIYFIDSTATANTGNRGIINNVVYGTGKPQTYTLSMITPGQWPGELPIPPDQYSNEEFMLQTNLVSQTITNWNYVAYGADIFPPEISTPVTVGNTTVNIPRGGILDEDLVPGRIVVEAETLDLSNARFHAENLISIKASEMVGTPPLATDALRFNLDLASTQEKLLIENLVPDTVKRLTGSISAWTGIWTNQVQEITTDTNDVTVTNITGNITYYATIVDYAFNTTIASQVQNFAAKNPNSVELNDSFSILSTFKVESPAFINRGNITPLNEDQNFDENNLIGVLDFQNEGSLQAFNRVSLARDLERPDQQIAQRFQSIVNEGSIFATSFTADAVEFSNSGSIESYVGPLGISADFIKLDDGSIFSSGNLILKGNELKADNSVLATSSGAIILDISDDLTDAGDLGAGNSWQTAYGVQMVNKPATGDLLSTTIETIAPSFSAVDHIWTGEDRGASETGYSDNVALGALVLSGNRFNLFRFSGPQGSPAALYVDYLELPTEGISDYSTILEIDENFTLYFRDTNVDAEALVEAFDGRIQQVGSSENESQTGSDSETILGAAVSSTVSQSGNPMVNLSVSALPNTSYEIQYSDTLVNADWKAVETVSNSSGSASSVAVQVELPAGIDQRFFRAVQIQ